MARRARKGHKPSRVSSATDSTDCAASPSQPLDIVPGLLNALNNAGPPLLDRQAISDIYSHIISQVAADPDNLTHDDLANARVPLAEAITAAKQDATDPPPSPPQPTQPEEHITLDAVATKPAPDAPPMALTPLLEMFLGSISEILREKNGDKIKDYLVIEPPYEPIYDAMIKEITEHYPKGSDKILESSIEAALPEVRECDDGTSWGAFTAALVQYFTFLRDVDLKDMLRTYFHLSVLVAYVQTSPALSPKHANGRNRKTNTALTHPSMGIVVLPTVIAYSKLLGRLSIGLEKNSDIVRPLVRRTMMDGSSRESLPEKATNIMRQAFVTCLNDRAGGINGLKGGKPQGKKVAVYTIANLCLKILFECEKHRNAETFFNNIHASAPPLEAYPAAERVTYLYYLGRFHFIFAHYYRAVLALESAYAQCHPSALKQRRIILVYLMTSSIILGRFPSQALYQRPEAAGLAEKFQPICQAIAKGDLATFKHLTSLKRPDVQWFLKYRILLQLGNRCIVLVWRSLCRKVFLLTGDIGDMTSRKASTLNLNHVLAAFRYLERRALPPGQEAYVDPDFKGLVDPKDREPQLPEMLEIESIMSSLIVQGFLGGFISHKHQKFAIQGAKRKGPLVAGFPNVWEAIKAKYDGEVPGWKVAGGAGYADLA